MRQALREKGMEVYSVGPLRDFALWRRIFRKLLCQVTSGFRHLYDWEPDLLEGYAGQVQEAIERIRPDVILAHNAVSIAYLKTGLPHVLWTDATFACRANFYPRFKNLCSDTVRTGNAAEGLALAKAALAIYTSEWAAASAVRDYPVDERKVKVVVPGANLASPRSREEIVRIIESRPKNSLRLLWVGMDWKRKGAEKAVEIASTLNRSGFRAHLKIIGCLPPLGFKVPPGVSILGPIDPSADRGRELLECLYAESHFLLLPTVADCTPGVIREACSWGVPCVASKIGGLPSLVKHGISGALFSPEADAAEYATFITQAHGKPSTYANLALAAYSEYETRLNWSAAGTAIAALLRELTGHD